MFNVKKMFCNIYFISVIFFYSVPINAQLPTGWETTKRGGVAFRVGGNQTLEDLNAYAALFDTYGYKFALAMGLGNSEFDSQTYIDGIKALQAQGHVLFDITPNIRINYFNTKFTDYDYSTDAGVDHIIDIDAANKKICLKFEDVTPPYTSSLHTGTVDINGNTVTGSGFNSFIEDEYYLYFSSPLDTLVLINNINSDTEILIKDVWDDAIDLGNNTGVTYYSFDHTGIHMTPEALILIGEESLKLAAFYEIDRPYRFILPGTANTPWGAAPTELKTTFGDELGYLSAQTYPPTNSLKTYNEYDPDGTKRFGMQWGNFDEENWSIDKIKTTIADHIAKHRVLFNHNHFEGSYFTNTSALLQWCFDNEIPVKTVGEWADILYSTPQDAFINVFPPLDIDLDENGFPDGYTDNSYPNITLESTGGPLGLNDFCYSISAADPMCYISGLGGVEKGENDFEIWTKGGYGNIVVYFYVGNDTQSFTFPANTSEWTKYDLSHSTNGNHSLNIPESISLVSISIRSFDYVSGDIKIGGMSLKAHDPTPVELTSFTVQDSDLGVELDWRTATEVNNYGFEIERTLSPFGTSSDDAIDTSDVESNEWSIIGFVEGHGNSYSPKEYSFIDTTSLKGVVNYRLKQIDTDGIYEYSKVASISLSIVSVASLDAMKTNLDQNHPNPFNPSTIISYQLKKPVNVTIRVYDIIGHEVATLIKNKRQSAGSHSIEFNSFDYNNLSSGVYFYQIVAGQFVDTKKMLLLK